MQRKVWTSGWTERKRRKHQHFFSLLELDTPKQMASINSKRITHATRREAKQASAGTSTTLWTRNSLSNGVDLCSLLPSTATFFGLREDTGAQASNQKRNEEAAAEMPLLPVRRRTAAVGLAAAAGAPLLEPQPGDHGARAW